MAAGLGIASLVASAGGAAYSAMEAEKQKKLAKEQQKYQTASQAQQKVSAMKQAAQGSKQAQVAEIQAKRDKAASTEKISERQQRKGKQSLLTGDESGLAKQLQTII